MLGKLLWPDLGNCDKLDILACHSHKAGPGEARERYVFAGKNPRWVY